MIREAVETDLYEAVGLGLRFATESEYGALLQPDARSMYGLGQTIINAPHGKMLVSEKDGQINGMIGSLATVHPMSGTPVLSELFWYVSPESRGSGVKLLNLTEAWGRENGCGHSIMVAPNEHVAAFLLRMGYRPLEMHFIKAL